MPPKSPKNKVTASLTYVTQSVYPEQVPTQWYVDLCDSPGGTVRAEQLFPTPTATAVFTGIQPGTYEFRSGQRTAGGTAVGPVQHSASFKLTGKPS